MINFYCNTHNGIEPKHTQGKQRTLMCGSTFMSSEKQEHSISLGHVLDNTFDNISNLNHLLGDLTGLYWVWVNTTDEFVGVNQYCRFYDDNELERIGMPEKNCIYVSHFVSFGNENVWQQYQRCHTDMGIRLLYSAINKGKISLTKSMADQLNNCYKISTCNSFFAHRSIFNKLCNVLFNIVFELLDGTRYLLEHIQYGMHGNPNDLRMLAFLSERILNIIYNNAEYFLGKNVSIYPVTFCRK